MNRRFFLDSDETFRAILECAPDAMIIADADGVMLIVNAEAERLFDEDPGGFARLFKRYAHEVLPSAVFPSEEAALFETWRGAAAPGGGPGQQSARRGRD